MHPPTMTPFEYLSVLVSIIIGLGISHLLTGLGRLIQLRRRVRPYAPTYVWIALLLVIQIQIWWAAYDTRTDTDWSFFGFVAFLLIPILVALCSYVLVPDLEGERTELELRTAFHENRVWIHGLLALTVLTSLVRDLLQDGLPALDRDAAFRAAFFLLALLGMRLRSDAGQTALALGVAGLFCAYVAVLFVRLA